MPIPTLYLQVYGPLMTPPAESSSLTILSQSIYRLSSKNAKVINSVKTTFVSFIVVKQWKCLGITASELRRLYE